MNLKKKSLFPDCLYSLSLSLSYFFPLLVCFLNPCMSRIIWYLSFFDWYISLRIILSSSIQVLAKGKIAFLLMAE